MELSWTTFLLEIVNFLVLVWILQRFLYKPVQAVIARRRESVRSTLEQAREERSKAEELHKQCEAREADLAQRRKQMDAELDQQMAAERSRRMAELQEELKAEREKARSLAQREAEQQHQTLERQSRKIAAGFASRLLSRLAGPELEQSLIRMALEDLDSLEPQILKRLRDSDAGAQVTTAYPLAPEQRTRLSSALEEHLGERGNWRFETSPELLAGVRVRVGEWLLQASLADELAFFAGHRDE